MKTKEKMMMYVEIAKRAEKLDLYHGERHTLLMDLESADLTFNLRLEDLLNADDLNFSHDVLGIVNNVNRNTFPATDFGLFVPRYANS